jgi:ribosomal protein S13
MKKRTFSLSENQIEALQAIAEKTGLVISEHVRRAIDAYLRKETVLKQYTATRKSLKI